MESERTLKQQEEWAEVDSVDVSSDQNPCFLYEQAKNMQPIYDSNQNALASINRELEGFTQKYNCSLDELYKRAEEAVEFNEDYNRILSLFKQIAFLKR